MKSLGETLSEAREEKGLSLEQVTKETMIAERYLAALEKENLDIFPAETYAMGFLKNYAQYLGLDVGEMVKMYKGLKVQGEDIPYKELTKRPSNAPAVILITALAVVIAVIAGVGLYWTLKKPSAPKSEATVVEVQRKPVRYDLSKETPKRMYPGDSVLIPLGGTDFKITLDTLGDTASFTTPDGKLTLDMAGSSQIDLNHDGTPDVYITVDDIAKNNPAQNGAEIVFRLEDASVNSSDDDAAQAQPPAPTPGKANANSPKPAPVGAGSVTLVTQVQPSPMTIQAAFSGSCMFRWEVLQEAARAGRNEVFFTRGQSQEITANNGVRLWISNANAVKITAIVSGRSVPVDMVQGRDIVVVADIRWVIGDDGRYNLIFNRLES
jgi:cytoskeletal protein RodZ